MNESSPATRSDLDDKTIALIESVATKVRASIEGGRLPDITLPVRSLDNVTYDEAKGYFELGDARKVRSLTVTTAARSPMRPGSQGAHAVTWLRSPRSSVERPVPPPMATTRSGRAGTVPVICCGSGSGFDDMVAGIKETLGNLGI